MPTYTLVINRVDGVKAERRKFTADDHAAALVSARAQMDEFNDADLAILTDNRGNPITQMRGRSGPPVPPKGGMGC